MDLGLRASDLRLWISDFGFRVYGLGYSEMETLGPFQGLGIVRMLHRFYLKGLGFNGLRALGLEGLEVWNTLNP